MSLSSTIAHDRPAPMRRFGLKRAVLVGVGLAVAIGFAAMSSSPTSEVGESTHTGPAVLTYSEFVELNTAALDALAPVQPSVGDRRFRYWNVEALEGFSPSLVASRVGGADRDFLYWNTGSIEYQRTAHSDSPTGPR